MDDRACPLGHGVCELVGEEIEMIRGYGRCCHEYIIGGAKVRKKRGIKSCCSSADNSS